MLKSTPARKKVHYRSSCNSDKYLRCGNLSFILTSIQLFRSGLRFAKRFENPFWERNLLGVFLCARLEAATSVSTTWKNFK